MVPIDDQCIAVKDGRDALAMSVLGLHLAEFFVPHQLAIKVQAIEPVRSEECKQMLAIGNGRVGRQAGGEMTAFVRKLSVQDLLPQNLAVSAANGEHHELVSMRHRSAVVCAFGLAVTGWECFSEGCRRSQENPVLPDDGRRVAQAGQRRLPTDVLFFAPLERRISVGCDAGSERPTPLRPIVLGIAFVIADHGSHKHEQPS